MNTLVANLRNKKLEWKKIKAESLDLDYTQLYSRNAADTIFETLEANLKYLTGDLSCVKVYGKVHPIPRQQVAHGDPGITYTFSGVTVPALSWLPILEELRNTLADVTGYRFDFALINRYRNGNDHIGEHRDNEKELDSSAPIASLSFGQTRTFMLRHCDARKSGPEKRLISPVKIDLEHGCLLLMNPPTNAIWYHSIPIRKKAPGVRINLTFRKYRRIK